MNSLSVDEKEYYDRHIRLKDFGEINQLKLKESAVLVVGAGGLASPVLQYLAAAGIGKITCVDFDTVDVSNLHRQIIHHYSDIGKQKTESAKEKINQINPAIDVKTINQKISSKNAFEIVSEFDLIIDCSDNFPTRYLLNDVAVLKKKLLIYAGIHEYEGHVTIFADQTGPCYRCLYPIPPKVGQIPNCAEAGVLGVLPAVLGSVQATEAIKMLTGIGQSLIGRLLTYNAKNMVFNEFSIKKRNSCEICGDYANIKSLIDYDDFCGLTKSDSISVSSLMANNYSNLIDIRTSNELQQIPLSGWRHIEMESLISNPEQLDRNQDYVFICHSGIRSLQLVEHLKNNDYQSVYSLSGGILKLLRDTNYSDR